MADALQGLVAEAKKNKFSTIGPCLSDEDVASVWESVSCFIEKQMAQQKGVNVPGLGTFTFSQKKLDVGNNKFILIQRPVFILSEKFAQTHDVHCTKHHVSGQIPVVQLNFAALSFETPFDRDSVEACVKEVLSALQRSVSAKRNVEFTFSSIGRLHIRDNKVKMKFYKEFITSMDGSGQMIKTMKDRPGTMDSVMSERPGSRPQTNTFVLPRISQGASLDLVPEEPEEGDQAPAVMADVLRTDDGETLDIDGILAGALEATNNANNTLDNIAEDKKGLGAPLTSRSGSRMMVPIAKATGVSFVDDLLPRTPTLGSPKGLRGVPALSKTPPAAARLTPLCPSPRSAMDDEPVLRRPSPPTDRPNTSSCGHPNAGQELCYLCHQRARRNIPVSFTEERRRKEEEEDKLLQQYQHMKDTDAIIDEQDQSLAKQHLNQKIAAFNLGVSEAVNSKKASRDVKPYSSYIFQKRPLTPPRFIKQDLYSKDLADQVKANCDNQKKRKSDEEFLERLEQVQLAEDLAAQRDHYMKDKMDQQDQYKRALSAQIRVRDSMCSPSDMPKIRADKKLGPLTLPRPQIIIPFSQSFTMKIQDGIGDKKRVLRFKPQPIAARVSDSSEPIFGKNDMNNDKMLERRRHAHELYQSQLGTVEQRKREAILQRLQEQRDEEEMLQRTKDELLNDRADRYQRLFTNRKHLEDDWFHSVDVKKGREAEERRHTRSAGMLLHEQCDKYKRCGQCERTMKNCGESNIWRESRYIPGSRLMV